MNELEQWMANGHRCPASETLFSYATSVDVREGADDAHPSTVKDLRSCFLLVDQCPMLRGKIMRVAGVSRQWAEVISFWDDLFVIYDLENPDWRDREGKAPQTEKMLKTLIGADDADSSN